MKTFAIMALALAASLPVYGATPEFSPYVGGFPSFGERGALINGKKVTLVAITAFVHDMDLPPGGVQELDGETKYFVKDDGAGNMAHCEKWIKQVRADERAWTKKDATYPYLEINVATNAKPLTWKGMTVYRGFDVRCWEVMDFGQPEF